MAEWIPDLTILYSQDGEQWQRYLIRGLVKVSWPRILQIQHQKLQELNLPPPASVLQHIASSRATLVILSPEFLKFVRCHKVEMRKLSRALKPNRTLAVLCGLLPSELSIFDVSCLPGYCSWKCLVASERDARFLILVVHSTLKMIGRNLVPKSQFKLRPNIVTQDSSEVLVMLKNPMKKEQLIEVLIDGDGINPIPVKRENPYILKLVIPVYMMRTSKTINVLVRCDDDLLGIQPLQCRSKMSQLHFLLSEVDYPHRLLGRILGANNLQEIDSRLRQIFQNNSETFPSSGLPLLDTTILGPLRPIGDEHLPTLLHFSTSYGFEQLTRQLLECPGAAAACQLPNCSDFTPSGLASASGYHRIYELLKDFQKQIVTEKKLQEVQSRMSCSPTVYDCLKPHEKLILNLDHRQEFSQELNSLRLEERESLSDKIEKKKTEKGGKEEDKNESLHSTQKTENSRLEAAGRNRHISNELRTKDVCPKTQTRELNPLVRIKRIFSRMVNKNHREFQVTRSYLRPVIHQESYTSDLARVYNPSSDHRQSSISRYCNLEVLQKEENTRQKTGVLEQRLDSAPLPPPRPVWTLATKRQTILSKGHQTIEGEDEDSDSSDYVEPNPPTPPPDHLCYGQKMGNIYPPRSHTSLDTMSQNAGHQVIC